MIVRERWRLMSTDVSGYDIEGEAGGQKMLMALPVWHGCGRACQLQPDVAGSRYWTGPPLSLRSSVSSGIYLQ